MCYRQDSNPTKWLCELLDAQVELHVKKQEMGGETPRGIHLKWCTWKGPKEREYNVLDCTGDST